jgi:hypothetical protein
VFPAAGFISGFLITLDYSTLGTTAGTTFFWDCDFYYDLGFGFSSYVF